MCGLSLSSPEEIERIAQPEADEPDKILRIRHNVKFGSLVAPAAVSDLCELTRLNEGENGVYPAKGGFRISENSLYGLRGRICLNFSNAGARLSKGPKYQAINELTPLYVGLPGQGEPGRSREGIKCGKHALKHGDIVGTYNAELVIKKREQFRHCNNINCPICWVRYVKDHAHVASTLIWDTRDMLARQGYTPMVYHVVLSPPQGFEAANLIKASTYEGYVDLRAEANDILRQLGALGGALFYHPFRENGQDGLKNGEITGNDGEPLHWRIGAQHWHAIVIFNGIPPLDRIAEIHKKTGFVINFRTLDDKAPRGEDYLSNARIKTLDDCEYLANYLYSHIGVIKKIGGKKRLPALTYIENSHPSKIRTLELRHGVPLLLQGYTGRAVSEDPDINGQVLYWRQLLIDLPAMNPNLSEDEIKRLSEVERINSGFVRCAAADYEYCKKAIEEEAARQKALGLVHWIGPASYDLDVKELWALIRGDPRFITQFMPMEEEGGLRNPRILQVDGEQLGYIFGTSDNAQLSEYDLFVKEADMREAEYMELKARSLSRYKGADQ